jgi:hypothetical protein
MHEDFHPRLVDIVAPAALVIDAHDRFDEGEYVGLRDEAADLMADERGTAEPAADEHAIADLVALVA